MSIVSDWPLPTAGVRFYVPDFMVRLYQSNALCEDLYPLRVGYYPRAQGHQMERVEHDDYLIIYCTDGAAELVVEGRRHRVGQGDFIVLPRDCLHSYKADEQNPWTIFWAHFDGRLAQSYIDNLDYSFENPFIPLGLLPRLISEFEALMAVRKTGFSKKVYIYAANQLRQLLTYVATQVPKVTRGADNTFDIDRIHGLMQQHIHDHIDLDQLATSVNLSKYYFCKKYKQLTGYSPIQQFINMKMEHACYLIDVSNKSMGEVARMIGYDDVYYFSRLFKKVIGMSPTAYKKIRYR